MEAGQHPELETPRLCVRLVTGADLPALLEVNGDDAVTRFLPYESWRTMDDALAWYQRVLGRHAAGTALQYVVLDKATDRVIGSCLLFQFDEGSARAELGYVLGRESWGSGRMGEALQALVGHAFGRLGVRRLEAEVDPRNGPSLRLLERLGFVREGLLRQRWVNKGVPIDVAAYGLLRDEWSQPA
jgi:RimJ/RimL family protein N-acetyltransferase